MDLTDILDLLLRWFHVIAGIMWIGNSLLFNWIDRSLVKKDGIEGEIWLLHSGGFYEVKKRMLEPGKMPDSKVHWFMWQNLTTWASGILLLIVVYYLGTSAWLVDPGAGHASFGFATFVGITTLVGGWVVYDLIWKSPLGNHPVALGAVCFALLVAAAWMLSLYMTPRAAFIHVGVLIGTLMTGNVWFVIIPSQIDLVDATKSGRPQDPSLGMKAKKRSVHNNYMTFPLLFIMVSNHFPALYSHQLNWVLLTCLMIGGAAVRYFMNIRWTFKYWLPAMVGSGAAAILATWMLVSTPAMPTMDNEILAKGPPVAFEEAHAIIALRCVSCHSKTPSDPLFPTAPKGMRFDEPVQIIDAVDRIRVRVEAGTMPFANRTQMTEQERITVVRWIAQGARQF